MNIPKAFLYTILLLVFDYVMFYIFTICFENNYLQSNLSFYAFNILMLASYGFSYWLIIFKIFKLKLNWKKSVEQLKAINLNYVFYLAVITIGLHFFEQPLFDFLDIVDVAKGDDRLPFQFYYDDTFTLIISGFLALIMAPIFEELLFRKLMFQELRKRHALTIAILVSSVCFSLIHYSNLLNLFPTFVFGVVCCIIYIETKSIIYLIILHFIGNLLWLLLSIFGEPYAKWIYDLNFDFLYWSIVVCGILLTILGLKNIAAINKKSS